jgi:hypothetical protein
MRVIACVAVVPIRVLAKVKLADDRLTAGAVPGDGSVFPAVPIILI